MITLENTVEHLSRNRLIALIKSLLEQGKQAEVELGEKDKIINELMEENKKYKKLYRNYRDRVDRGC